MSLTLSSRKMNPLGGGRRMVIGDLAFDSSYPFGGESLALTTLGLDKLDMVMIAAKLGYTFEYDFTNNKVKVFAPAPPIVIEEEQTIASNQVTLNYPAAAILNIATATQCQLLIEASDTLAANEVQLQPPWLPAKDRPLRFMPAHRER